MLVQGKLDEARPLFEETLRIMRVAFGSNHPRVSIAINNLATLLQAQVCEKVFSLFKDKNNK